MNAIAEKDIQNAAYSQMIALLDGTRTARLCIEMVAESLVEEFSCSLRRATYITTAAWADLDSAGSFETAYVDASRTTGNMVVVQDPTTGRTSIFSVRELLALREQATTHQLTA